MSLANEICATLGLKPPEVPSKIWVIGHYFQQVAVWYEWKTFIQTWHPGATEVSFDFDYEDARCVSGFTVDVPPTFDQDADTPDEYDDEWRNLSVPNCDYFDFRQPPKCWFSEADIRNTVDETIRFLRAHPDAWVGDTK